MNLGEDMRLRAIGLFVLLIIADTSAGIYIETDEGMAPKIVENVPPLDCGEHLCLVPDRDIDREERPASEEYGWWYAYGPDRDFNGMDDRLQWILHGDESISPTAIIGADGRKTVAIVVDFAWHPTGEDIEILKSILRKHGWAEEEAWFFPYDSTDAISIDKVPVSALIEIWQLPQVVVVEMQNVMVPLMDVAARAARARESEVYTGTLHDRGYTGEDIVIAVLDSGVDNEHRSLNDFDDKDDDPDLDANSYDDQKWLGGFDATSTASDQSGNQDPDDGQSHGTHVAGIALGTGDASRVHTGVAPGAYLVDVKVLTDTGGTNSAYSEAGIQWVINNRDREWDGSDSARGIQIAQMSFGSIGNPIGGDDTGDNGTSNQARLVNNATENGVVCVIAIGNDGRQRVASPASADGAITVGAVTDRDSINRTDDSIASYSNWGPRDDDGDDDEWDELKPDIVSYGSGIMSATYAPGTTGFPGQPRDMADDEYDSKDGTSMSTPLVSGIVALMLQADDSLTPQEIKDILRNSSEVREGVDGQASEPDVSNRWNHKWGFGLADASCAVDTVLDRKCTPLYGGGDGVVVDPDPDNETKYFTEILSPTNASWLLVDETIRISGKIIDEAPDEFDDVFISIEQVDNEGERISLMDWTAAGGDREDWYLDVKIKDEWRNAQEDYTLIYAMAVESSQSGEIVTSSTQGYVFTYIGRMQTSISTPSSGSSIDGSVTFSGTVEGIEHDILQYKVDNGDWNLAAELPELESGAQEWSFSWDSTSVNDGTHKMSVRMINKSGIKSEAMTRTYIVDNQPPAPALSFQGTVEVMDGALPALDVVAGTILEIRFNVANTGDATARDVFVKIDAPGEASDTYPQEGIIPSIKSGESTSMSLWWWATESGKQTVNILIDPNKGIEGEIDTTDNTYSFDITIKERPFTPMLQFLSGAVTVQSEIPTPETAFSISVRIDNLGQTAATDIGVQLQRWSEESGFTIIENQSISVIPGSNTSSGYAKVTFSDKTGGVGGIDYRILLSGNGVTSEHSELRFGIICDLYDVGAGIETTLSDDEYVVDFISLERGSILFTTRNGELHARTISGALAMPSDTLIESDWTGEFAVTDREDGRAQMVWSKGTTDASGYILSDIGIASIGVSGDISPIQSHLQAIKQSEGKYWGFSLDEKDGEVVIAAYHRDIATSGSWLDVTSIFLYSSSSPDIENSWVLTDDVVSNIDIKPQEGNALAVGIGVNYIHILYQEMRDDVTGLDRTGMFYAHGYLNSNSWNFLYAVGDNASGQSMKIGTIDDEDVIIAAWIEDFGKESKVVTAVTDQSWSLKNPQRVRSPGVTSVTLVETDTSVQLFYDEVGVYGPLTKYALYVFEQDSEFSFSNALEYGYLFSAGKTKTDGVMVLVSPAGGISLVPIVSLEKEVTTANKDSFFDVLIESMPGDSTEAKLAFFGVALFSVLIILIGVVRTLRKSRKENLALTEDISINTSDEDDIELLIDPEADIPYEEIEIEMEEVTVDIPSSDTINLAESLEQKSQSGEGSLRLDRRLKRKEEREQKEMFDSFVASMPPPPLPGQITHASDETQQEAPSLPEMSLPLPPLPTPERNIVCQECSASFKLKDMMLVKIDCPVCQTEIKLR